MFELKLKMDLSLSPCLHMMNTCRAIPLYPPSRFPRLESRQVLAGPGGQV